jgi:hypothetical protein
MRPNITVSEAEFLGGHKRNDDPARRISESVGLDNDDKWNHSVIPARVPVNA